MCGACGSGRVRAPWEDTVGARDPATSRRLAAALTGRLRRWRVAPWAGGYTVAAPQGALAPARSIDEVVARGRDAGVLAGAAPGEDLALAEALVAASVLALDGPVVLSGPDPGAPRRVLAHGHVPVDVVPRPSVGWGVSGASVPFGA
ncbi:hypothetical protein GCM10023200_17710 [Actinomycetospora chlora]|uniref:Uncharacterized protein n=1 Tax=Actinomycetospora chlora TaxID=663608 RepID=A0ABP9APT5_9PSEU